ncbi:hypothetical protein VTO42DRAFT_431 [Malbranchea cinnamomea]
MSANNTFEKLKRMFVSAPILRQFDADLETVVETNSSNYVELLAIVKCCREWESELKSKLNECQIRGQEFLRQFNFRIKYRPGLEGTLPDVLSRPEQDMLQDADDRFVHREACLLKPEVFINTRQAAHVNYLCVATLPLYVKPVTTNVTLDPSEWQELEALWKTAELNNPQW